MMMMVYMRRYFYFIFGEYECMCLGLVQFISAYCQECIIPLRIHTHIASGFYRYVFIPHDDAWKC